MDRKILNRLSVEELCEVLCEKLEEDVVDTFRENRIGGKEVLKLSD